MIRPELSRCSLDAGELSLIQFKAVTGQASDDELVLLRMHLYRMSEEEARRNLKRYRLSFLFG